MAIEAIVVSCTLIGRCNIESADSYKLTALDLDLFLRNTDLFRDTDEIYLITTELNRQLFVLYKLNKLKGIHKTAKKIADRLNIPITVVKISSNRDSVVTKTVICSFDSSLSNLESTIEKLEEKDF